MGANALFGRYWAADSPLHQLDPRTKLLGTLLLVITMFIADTFISLGVVALFVAALIALARIPVSKVLKSIVPLSFIIVLTGLFNLLYVQGGDVYLDWGRLVVSQRGVHMALFVALRLTLLLLAGSLLTLTTTTIDITEAFERLLWPLRRIGLPAHEFALVLGIALRFLPQFVEEFHTIRAAQLSRGVQLATSPLRNGLTQITSLIVPLFTSAFRHAETLSGAMDARCYHGAVGRTKLHPLVFTRADALSAVTLLALLGCVIILAMLY